jgi:hypothetical protein
MLLNTSYTLADIMDIPLLSGPITSTPFNAQDSFASWCDTDSGLDSGPVVLPD